jgi:hypothetical protein
VTAVAEERPAAGFEYEGEFYVFQYGDIGKDLMLIDRLTGGMTFPEFLEADTGRGPVQLAIIACSIRAAHPDWSVEMIYRRVSNLSLNKDILFVDADTEEVTPDPTAAQEPSPPPTGAGSSSPSNGSSSPSTRPATTASETSSATRR